jgi:hypothetical protein
VVTPAPEVAPTPAAAPAPAPPPAQPPADRTAKHPDYPTPGLRLVIGGAPVGTCARIDSNVGLSSFCTEGFIGLALTPISRFHIDFEAGGGWLGASLSGDPSFGVAYSSGGPYVVVRAMAGSDLTPLFFWRAGVQTRLFMIDAVERANAGVQLVGDLGTRVWRFEIGTRGVLGFDGVNEGGINDTSGHSWAPAPTYGLSLFARYVTP